MPTLNIRGQQGVAMIFALIFLVVIAIMGAAVASVAGLEERMAGNTRERDLAFQAAEAALRDAQLQLVNSATPRCNDGRVRRQADGEFSTTDSNGRSHWDAIFGDVGSTCTDCFDMGTGSLSIGAGKLFDTPKYVIEQKLSVPLPPFGADQLRRYRVTARGVGGTADSVVILQAEFTCDGSSCGMCNP